MSRKAVRTGQRYRLVSDVLGEPDLKIYQVVVPEINYTAYKSIVDKLKEQLAASGGFVNVDMVRDDIKVYPKNITLWAPDDSENNIKGIVLKQLHRAGFTTKIDEVEVRVSK